VITINTMIAKAIDTKDAKLASQISDILRNRGCNYDEIVQRVLKIRPGITSADWDALVYESEEEST